MLELLKKRDGRIEPYEPNKINNWGQWGMPGSNEWAGVVAKTVRSFAGEKIVSTQALQKRLIEYCLAEKTWLHAKMAGRLYAASLRKELYDEYTPTIQALHHKLFKADLMIELPYSAEEYRQIGTFIDHERDYNLVHFQVHQIRKKYALRSRKTKKEYETPQFVFMRMAMELASKEPKDTRLEHVKAFYDHFSQSTVNPPSPNYINLGTRLRGFASCCLIAANDTIDSLAIHDHIAYKMTAMSAGIGTHIQTRGVGDPVRGGVIEHQGKLGYYRSLAKAVKANIQAGRGGACNTHYTAFDPEATLIAGIQNPRATEEKRNRDIHFTVIFNRLFRQKVAACEPVFQFTSWSQPELWKLMFSADIDGFTALYNQIDADASIPKTYIDARDFAKLAMQQSHEVSTHYVAFIDEMNRHTPFYEPIRSSNLCVEISEPTEAYENMMDLYAEKDNGFIRFETQSGKELTIPHSDRVVVLRNNDRKVTYAGALKSKDVIYECDWLDLTEELPAVDTILEHVPTSEVALCSLAAIPVCNITSDEQYASAAYYALKMIDYCIHASEYVLPHIGWTAKNRMNAAVGLMGVATVMARQKVKYGTQEGYDLFHRIGERHAYHVIQASVRIAEERGPAPWIHKTKWHEGWLPIDTYNRNVDKITQEPLHYDWEALRKRMIKAGGTGHSALIAHMPTESSSKASGAPKTVYPIEELATGKSDGSNVVDWVAMEADTLDYCLAYDIPTHGMIKQYCVLQKFTDQSISADLFKNRAKEKLTETELINDFLLMGEGGMKTRYYQNTFAYEAEEQEAGNGIIDAIQAVLKEAGTTPPPLYATTAPLVPAPAAAVEHVSIDFGDAQDTLRGCSSGACSV